MESGGAGVPEMEMGVPLERMPSSAESESAFSTATEAESEMTDAADYEEGQSTTPRQTYFLSYATDCLSAFDLVKKRSLTGIRALDDVSGKWHAVLHWEGGGVTANVTKKAYLAHKANVLRYVTLQVLLLLCIGSGSLLLLGGGVYWRLCRVRHCSI